MTCVRVIRSVAEARPVLRDLWRSGATVGSVHTLGALHQAHGELIKRSAAENDHTIVTIYPNKIQLFEGCVYQYDLDEDIAVAQQYGATIVIASDDAEMYPPGYVTYIDQGERARRLRACVRTDRLAGWVVWSLWWLVVVYGRGGAWFVWEG